MPSQFQKLVDKCITDKHFRQQFEADRVKAVESLGVHVTPNIEKALNNLDVHGIVNLAIQMQGPTQVT